MEGLERIVGEHPFFAGLGDAFRDLVAGCAKNVVFRAGQYMFHEGGDADQLYLLREGRVALEVAAPGRGPITIQTLKAGEIVGVSWLFAPYRWSYDAKVLEPVRAIAMDAACLRRKCDEDPVLGYEVMKRVAPILIGRLHATRMQLLDVYGTAR